MTPEAEFEILSDPSFHDDCIYALRFTPPEPERDDWRSELSLDIDHILDWIANQGERMRFSIVQTRLSFEYVSDLRIAMAYPESTIYPLPIDYIARSKTPVEARGEDFKVFKWRIQLNDRAGGSLAFRSSGFRLEHVGQPELCDEQTLPPHRRK